MTRYAQIFALFVIIAFHQTGCTVEDPQYADESAALESHDVSALPAQEDLVSESAQSESSDIGIESGTWQLVGSEYCPDLCGGTCTSCGIFSPSCPPSPRGQACDPLHATCWTIMSGNLYAREWECL